MQDRRQTRAFEEYVPRMRKSVKCCNMLKAFENAQIKYLVITLYL